MQQEETPKVRRIRQVSVTNLFGIFNHTLPLNMHERLTIIHGPNGFGKTTMFKLLHELFSESNHLLQKIPFDEFRVDFEDDTSLWARKNPLSMGSTKDEQSDKQKIVFHLTNQNPYVLHPVPLLSDNNSIPLSIITNLLPILDRVESDTWRHIFTNERFSLEGIVARFADRLSPELVGERTNMPKWLLEIRKSVPMRFIETQRLLNSINPSSRNHRHYDKFDTKYEYKVTREYGIAEFSKRLVEMISHKLAESAYLSQSLDRTFPARLINPTMQQLHVTEDDLVSKLKKLEEKRLRLMAAGLLDKETETAFPVGSVQEIEPNTKAVLAVYIE
ncbi:MAG: hypothetical protein ACRDHZ_03580, partial [Ktedonobacteraceae bacterium]